MGPAVIHAKVTYGGTDGLEPSERRPAPPERDSVTPAEFSGMRTTGIRRQAPIEKVTWLLVVSEVGEHERVWRHDDGVKTRTTTDDCGKGIREHRGDQEWCNDYLPIVL